MDTKKNHNKINYKVLKGMISHARSKEEGIVLEIMLMKFFFRINFYGNLC